VDFDEKVVRPELWQRCVDQRGLFRAGAFVGFHCGRERHCREWLSGQCKCWNLLVTADPIFLQAVESRLVRDRILDEL